VRRVPETPEQLGLLVLTSQLRRNAQRGMLGGALSLPLLGITEAKRGDWVIAALLCAATLLQCLLVVLKLRKINQILDGLANPAAAGAGPVANPTQVTLLLGLGMTIALLGLVGLSPLPLARAVPEAAIDARLIVLGLLATALALFAISRRVSEKTPVAPDIPRPALVATAPAPMPKPQAGDPGVDTAYQGEAITCSGGGIRSAAFCLGALQRLMAAGVYDRADRVYAISGGSYVATGLHLARRCSEPLGSPPADLFTPSSPEMDWLRRHSSFLMPTPTIRLRGILALVYGVVMTLALLVAGLWSATAYAVWVLDRLPGQGVPALDATQASFDVSPGLWLALALIGGAGVLWYALVTARWKYQRTRLASVVPTTLFLGLALTAVVGLVVIPKLVVLAHNATVSNEPTAAIAKALSVTPIVPAAICETATQEDFVRQAQIAWHRTPDPERASTIPFTYGACGQTYGDDVLPFATGDPKAPPTAWPGCFAGTDLALTRALPHSCDRTQDTTGGWATRLAGLAALATTLAATWRRHGTPEATTKPGKLVAFIRRRVLPWSALAAALALLAIVGIWMGRSLSVNLARLDDYATFLILPITYAVVRLLGDAMATSLHPFYRERLADTFLVRRTTNGGVEPIPLWDTPVDPGLATGSNTDAEAPGPQLSILCAANVSDADYIPTQRGCTTFRFETGRRTHGMERPRAYVGITDARLPHTGSGRAAGGERPIPLSPTAYALAADPEGRDTTLAAAMAASGAAFSPIIGRKQAMIAPYRLLLTLANARLGIWLPNPYMALVTTSDPGLTAPLPARSAARTAFERLVRKPGPFRIVKEAVGLQSITDSRIYVSDGGHFDNTGLVEALRDRPRRIIVLDASADPHGTLDALTDAMTTARMDLGLLITPIGRDGLTPASGDPASTARPERGWLHLQARVAGRGRVVCDIFFVKNVLSQGSDPELDAYQLDHPGFPVTTTVNQFYGEYDFEAYRQLGWCNTEALLSANPQLMGAP